MNFLFYFLSSFGIHHDNNNNNHNKIKFFFLPSLRYIQINTNRNNKRKKREIRICYITPAKKHKNPKYKHEIK